MGVKIRRMDKHDIPAVQQVAKISWHDTYRGVIPFVIQERFLTAAYSYETLKRRLLQSFIFLAEVDDQVIGFANFSRIQQDGSTELGAIYLLPEYQSKGIGTALLMHGIKTLAAEAVFIYVEKNNQSGLSFYQARGFEKLSEFNESLYGHEVETIKMRLLVETMTKQ